ncbi:MAG: NADP(H)-dependent aldo-keto reductase [Flavobacteriales bacterium]
MKYDLLGTTGIKVSKICLGTMTWGEQNTEREAHEQLDYAATQGINFIDTAELYAIPTDKNTQGLTEKYIGTWLKNQNREEWIVASKISGPNKDALQHIRGGLGFSGKGFIEQAVNTSLERLQTDYIDLYQLHWPERPTNFFGQLGYTHVSDDSITDFKYVLEALKKQIDAGKIRYIGLSNETPWGLMQYLKLADEFELPRVISNQDAYSLINRKFEVGMAEMAIRENCKLLAYSPLGGGILSGKYLNNQKPKGARYTNWPNYFARYSHENTIKSTQKYADLAKKSGLSLAQMALSFVNSRDFLTSNIIGATTLNQLKENIDSINITLNEEIINEIEKIHLEFPNPAP